ncbi:major facilitator superfamily domain-containing protein [Auriculariales sp. MPI-PUGE-AT-0066]|nr:major facilitator superfamily domain-containing protein [Auriculariales sp. MPI-PUGE-AT-0066]
MWSYVQYRRIGRDLRTQHQNRGTDIDKRPARDKHIDGEDTPNSAANKSERLRPARSKQDDVIRVEFMGDEDPLDPRNWSLLARSKNIAILSLLIFVQAWAGGAESMANSVASKEFGVSKTAENLSTAMYLFGIGTGALFCGPISETVGRNPTYLISTFCYMFFVLGCALTPTFGGQVVCRYLVGLFCSATLSINGASVRDQFRPVKRAFVFPIIAWANVAAPVIAPIAGGWIVSNPSLGWRWTEWVTLIISAFGFLVALLFLPETYPPILLDWKAKHLRRLTGDSRYRSEHSESPKFLCKMRETLPLPVTFLAREPVVAVLGAYLILLYVLLFTFQSGFDYIFKETYGLSPGITGSCFGAVAAGATAFTLGAPGLYSWARYHTEFVQGASITPEFRLWPGIVAAPLLPICLFWLGWTDYRTASIWSALGACFLFGVVLIALYVSCYEYIVDSYGDHSAIALSSVTMARYLVAGGMVMVARPMYEGLGVHWTMSLLGCVAAVLAPAPLVFWKIGHRLRRNSPYAKA